jgi:hypothetical protein
MLGQLLIATGIAAVCVALVLADWLRSRLDHATTEGLSGDETTRPWVSHSIVASNNR